MSRKTDSARMLFKIVALIHRSLVDLYTYWATMTLTYVVWYNLSVAENILVSCTNGKLLY